jgi:Dolichyl-phosphate-mannose-protein mannosyltransferase
MRLAMTWGSPAQLDGQASQTLPRQAAWRQAARAVVRRHWLAIALLAAGLVLRVLALLADRPALLFVDSVRYLYNAYGMDPVGYSGALKAILFAANLDTVAVVQHLLGLGMAVVIYALLLRLGVSRWLAALAIAPVLLDAYQLQIEQMIMPDTFFEALIVAGLAILLWPRQEAGVSWPRVVTGGIVLGASATVAQVGEALLLPVVIYLLVVGGGWRRAVGRAAAVCASFALPILVYCTISFLLTGAFSLSNTGATGLYGRMAAAADCAALKLPADERTETIHWLTDHGRQVRSATVRMCPTRAQQAEGPDWLEYNPGSPIRPYYNHLPRGEVNSLLTNFNRQVLTQQPLRVAGAYAFDVVKLFALTRNTMPGDTSISRWQFQTKYTYYPPWVSEAVAKTATSRFGGGKPVVWRPVAAFLRGYQLHGGYTPGPLLAVFTVTGLAGSAIAAARRRRLDPATRQLALACLLCFLSGACVILVSDVLEFSWRYQLPALVTLVPAGALGISVITRSIGARRRPS